MANEEDDKKILYIPVDDWPGMVDKTIPPYICQTLANLPVAALPDADIDDELSADITKKLEEGRCHFCGGNLAENTIVIVNGAGIIAINCSVTCNQDMIQHGYLNQLIDDIEDAASFRSEGQFKG